VRREPLFRHTTILCVRRDGTVALGGDGQVTMGTTVVKQGASKVRRLLDGKILAGFAGSTADAITLFTRFERKLEEFHGQLERRRSSLRPTGGWRRRSAARGPSHRGGREDVAPPLGTGDVIAPTRGSSPSARGPVRAAAARALLRHSALDAPAIVKESLLIAASIDVYTNDAIRNRNAAMSRALRQADLSPRKIVAELDRHVVGQGKAKRAVAIALRERWRRQCLAPTWRARSRRRTF